MEYIQHVMCKCLALAPLELNAQTKATVLLDDLRQYNNINTFF